MSFDISVEVSRCAACGRGDGDVFSVNVTHNTNSFVERCMVLAGDPPVGKEMGAFYRERAWGRLEGWQCADVLEFLRRTRARMVDPHLAEELRAMEPANGWGSVATALRALDRLVGACRDNPTGIIRAHG